MVWKHGKSILEEGVTPTEVVRAASDSGDDSDGSDEVSATPGAQKEPAATPRPLSPDDPVLHKAIELFKTPVKKAA